MDKRGSFGSRLGIVLASAGSAVGLGNIWRFPTEVGRNGGAAFILIYIVCVVLLAMPVMVSEFVIGRASKANTVHSYRVLAPGKPWVVAGFMGVLGGLLVLSFYSVVAGWTLSYTVESWTGMLMGDQDFSAHFTSLSTLPFRPLAFIYMFLLLTHYVVAKGVQNGIERYSKLMMPLLFIILLVLVVLSLFMPGSSQGLRFLLKPDFSRINSDVILSAMGQAFFSLSVGIGCLVTYASYFKRDAHLISSAFNVCVIDTLVAVLSGFIIFPTVFSVHGVTPDAGPGLVFITLPNVFNTAFASAPILGYVFSALFYTLLLLAALTSSISMNEIATAFIHENYHVSRQYSTIIVTGIAIILGTACSLSLGVWSDVKMFGMGFFDFFDFVTAKFIMPLGGMLITVFVGWYLDRKLVIDEMTNEGAGWKRSARVVLFLIRWVAPVGVGAVFLNQLMH